MGRSRFRYTGQPGPRIVTSRSIRTDLLFWGVLVRHIAMICTLALSLGSPLGVHASEVTDWDRLTPFGAIQAGNADGSIPAWEGGISEPIAAYQGPGTMHPDPYADDAPLYTISAENMDQYAEQLSPGLQAMLRRYPETFRIPVYPSRRSHAAPQWVYDNTRKNDETASLSEGGNGVQNAYGGIPFPRPESALEVYWNHVTRWRGQFIANSGSDANIYADGKYTLITRDTEVKFHFYDPKGSAETLDNRLFSLKSVVTAPARLARSGVLVHETLDQDASPRLAWAYDSARRRVLRAPLLAFDMSVSNADALRTADDTDMINGSPSRFDWKLLGKREMIIPYNNYGIELGDYDQLLQPGHLNPENARYELHRVWVLEATLKPDWRHIYSRRVFYLDEDSWTVSIADQYDKSGKLWRVSLAYLKNFYEMPATLPALYVFHDLQAGRYHVQALAKDGKEAETLVEVPGDGQFTTQALQRFIR